MRMYARTTKALGTVLITAGLLLTGAPGAGAAEPTPLPAVNPPVLVSATVSGCEAPCAPGETGAVAIRFQLPAVPSNVPDGTQIHMRMYADGKLITRTPNASGDLNVRQWTICSGIRQPFEGCTTQSEVDQIRGAETFTATAQLRLWDDDPFEPQIIGLGPESEPSNALVPTQR